MSVVIVLAMHGAPALDYPRAELREFFGLGARIEQAPEPQRAALNARLSELDAKIRAWPRTAKNDPFYAGAQALAKAIERAAGAPVILGFNEFCAPALDEAMNIAARSAEEAGAENVVVITPMMTRGGEHSEVEIPEAVQSAQARHPNLHFHYAWPLEEDAVAGFLAGQVRRVLGDAATGPQPRGS